MRKLFCKLFGHKWKYNRYTPKTNRTCKRCGEENILSYSTKPIFGGEPEWIKVEE